MIYSDLVRKACDIAYNAHDFDIDKGGYPYILHPFYLAIQMDNEDAVCAALLHDVVEDHGDVYSFELLREGGFSEETLEALRLLTHKKGTPYVEYIRTLANNPIAREVKMADLRHNMDTTRTNGVVPSKYRLYKLALEYLEAHS